MDSTRRDGTLALRTGVAALALFALLGGACTASGDEDVRAVAPGALAEAAGRLDSGRFELSSLTPFGEAMTLSGRFQGEDIETTMIWEETGSGDDGPVSDPLDSAPMEFRTVDGITYVRGGLPDPLLGEDGDPSRWTRYPEEYLDAPEDLAEAESSLYEDMNPMDDLVSSLEAVVLDTPGEAAELDGREAVRYRAAITGADAVGMLTAVGLYYYPLDDGYFLGRADEGLDPDDPLAQVHERELRIMQALQDSAEAKIEAYLDAEGNLLGADVHMSIGLDGYEECELLEFTDHDAHMELRDLGEPQAIEPPAPDLVDEWVEPDLDELLEDIPDLDDLAEEGWEEFEGELPPEVADDFEAMLGFAEEMELPEDYQQDPVLQTSAGPRTRYRVLDELVRWAEERHIDWMSVPPLESDQLVALYDMFFAQELESRGPALETSDGLYSRGDLLDAVLGESDYLGIDESAAEAMPDSELVEHFEVLLAEGVYPQPGFFTGDPLGGSSADTFDDDWLDDDLDYYESLLEGCPS